MDLTSYYGAHADAEAAAARIEKIKEAFYRGENVPCERVFSSPGRAEILGNHTDHNHGLVIVAAISCDIVAAVRKRDDGKVKICSEGYPPFVVDLSDTERKPRETGTSVALTRGVARYLQEKGFSLSGFTAYLTSNVFKGAGVSSSADWEKSGSISSGTFLFLMACVIKIAATASTATTAASAMPSAAFFFGCFSGAAVGCAVSSEASCVLCSAVSASGASTSAACTVSSASCSGIAFTSCSDCSGWKPF